MNKIMKQFGMAACALFLGSSMSGRAQALTHSTPAAAEARSSGEKHIAAAVVPHSKAEQIACINNLKQIGLAARIWSNDEGGHLPKDFISLQKTLQNAGCLICPGDTANKQYANSSWADMDVKHISYQMVSPGAAETEPQKVYVRCPIHGIAAFADGSVQPEPPKQPAPPPPNHTVVAHSELKTARVAAPPSVPAIPHVEAVESLSRGLLDEEINNDPEQAAKKYQEIVNRFDQQRLEAGKAIFRLAECYRKLGRRDEAVVQYSRILREFVDQTDLARASQQQITPLLNQTARNRRIASTGIRLPVAPTVPIAPPMAIDPASGRHLIGESVAADTSMTAAEAKAQQANLLRAEINLLRSQLEQTREKFKAGVVSQEDTLKLEREILAFVSSIG